MKQNWKKQWKSSLSIWKLVSMNSSKHSMLKLHKNLQKMKNALITQIRTECIELTVFLNKANILSYKTSTCQCDQVRKTAAHIIVHCFRFAEIRHLLENSNTDQLDLQALTDTSESTQQLACWFMKLWILSQFQLAEQLLYENRDKMKKTQSDSKILWAVTQEKQAWKMSIWYYKLLERQ